MALDPSATAFSDTLVVLGAAGLVIPAFARLRVTPVIGFILVGILVGPHGLGSLIDRWPWLYHVSITDPHSLEPFAELGIILLLFTIGLELSFGRLWAMRRELFGFGASELFGSAVLIAAAFLLLGNTINASLGLGLALALSSTALVLPIAGTQSAVGRLALAMLLFEDLALVPIIFALGVLGPGGSDSAVLIRTIVGGVLMIGAMFVAGRFVLPRLFGSGGPHQEPRVVPGGQPDGRHPRQCRDPVGRPVADRRRVGGRAADRRNRLCGGGRNGRRAVQGARARACS